MRFITVDEYLMDRAKLHDLPEELVENVQVTVQRANDLLQVFGQFRKVNSGYRDHAANLAAGGKPNSKHLTCQAVDLEDADGKLKTFCLNHAPELERIGLWMEDPKSTPHWVHVQIVAPKSGHRVFIP
jgi:hypothetical protein